MEAGATKAMHLVFKHMQISAFLTHLTRALSPLHLSSREQASGKKRWKATPYLNASRLDKFMLLFTFHMNIKEPASYKHQNQVWRRFDGALFMTALYYVGCDETESSLSLSKNRLRINLVPGYRSIFQWLHLMFLISIIINLYLTR